MSNAAVSTFSQQTHHLIHLLPRMGIADGETDDDREVEIATF